MKIAIYPGTFDPITYGHIDVIKKSLKVFDKLIVVMQYDAFVFDANNSYFFEWKKLISDFVELDKSLMSEIVSLEKFSKLFIWDNFKSLSILKGPLFLKNGLIINKSFYQNS